MGYLRSMVAACACAAVVCVCACERQTRAPAGPAIVQPTEADAELLAEFDALGDDLVNEPGMRERLNHGRTPERQVLRDRLTGKTPSTEQELRGPRAYFSGIIRDVNANRDWPQPQPVRAGRTAGPITIDGRIDEKAWRDAPVLPIDHHAGGRDRVAAGPVATCRLLWDETHLYVAYDVPDRNIVGPDHERDSWLISQSDSVELFVLSSLRFGLYWELNLSPTGPIYDVLIFKHRDSWGGVKRLEETMRGLKVGRSVRGTPNIETDTDQGYTIEVAVPLDQVPGMSKTPAAGDQLYILLGYSDRSELPPAGKVSYYSHTPIAGWFHNIWAYTPLILVQDAKAN